MPYLGPETPGLGEMLRQFGAELRRCRYQAGWSQAQLAERSAVSQSTISRLERGKAPAAAMIKLVLLSDTLGYRFPLGFCPHDHACAWERLDEHGTPLRRRSGMGMGSLFDAMYPGLSDE